MTSDPAGLVAGIAREQRGAGGVVAPAAGPEAIMRARHYLQSRFGMPLPPVLATLWSTRDGIDFNGMRLYGAAWPSALRACGLCDGAGRVTPRSVGRRQRDFSRSCVIAWVRSCTSAVLA